MTLSNESLPGPTCKSSILYEEQTKIQLVGLHERFSVSILQLAYSTSNISNVLVNLSKVFLAVFVMSNKEFFTIAWKNSKIVQRMYRLKSTRKVELEYGSLRVDITIFTFVGFSFVHHLHWNLKEQYVPFSNLITGKVISSAVLQNLFWYIHGMVFIPVMFFHWLVCSIYVARLAGHLLQKHIYSKNTLVSTNVTGLVKLYTLASFNSFVSPKMFMKLNSNKK